MRNLYPALKAVVVAALVVLTVATVAYAGDCCDQCGCQCQVRKVCRLKCDVKKVPKVSYTCECEDFCVPGPSKREGCTCTVDCNGCEKCKPNQVPQCAKVRTKTKLYKHVEMEEKKVYKWVVEYVCDTCANTDCGCTNDEPATLQEGEAEPAPPQPPVPASASMGGSFFQTLFAK